MTEDFTDIMLPLKTPEEALAYPGPVHCYQDLRGHIDEILSHVEEHHDGSRRFRLSVDNYDYRVTRASTPAGDYLAMRRLLPNIRQLDDIGLPSEILRLLRSPGLSRGGLIIISGQAGHGKSTTCASIIKDRLAKFGGVCNTVEYPVELMMTGMEGMGLCLQRNTETPEEFDESIADALRSYPSKSNNILYVGEILHSGIAATVLKSAIDGHLVLTTMHASGAITTLERILALASERISYDEARQLLASGLRMVVNQNLKTVRENTVFRASYLIETDSVSRNIASGNSLKQLSTDTRTLKERLRNKQPLIAKFEK